MEDNRPFRIRLTDEDKTSFNRTLGPYSELEVRIMTPGQYDLREDIFYTLKRGLERLPDVSIEHQEYTNTVYDVYNEFGEKSRISSYRSTQMKGSQTITYMQKTKKPTPAFENTYSCFSIKCAEATETTIQESIIDKRKLSSVRTLKRDKITVPLNGLNYTYDVSEVTQSPSSKKTYEIEMELIYQSQLPALMTLAEYALSGISILLDILFEPYHFHPSYFIPERNLIVRYTERINKVTGFKKVDPPKYVKNGPYDINVRNDPKNLKTSLFGSLNDYAMTNKLDGERKLITFFEKDEDDQKRDTRADSGNLVLSGGMKSLIQGSEFMILHPGGFDTEKIDSAYCIPTKDKFESLILDAEYYQGQFNIFDVIQYGNLPLEEESNTVWQIEADIPHQQRMALLEETDRRKLGYHNMVTKRFYYGTLSDNLSQFIKDNSPDSFFNNNDGLIFSEKTKSYRTAQHYKYKFPSKMSIDFKLDATKVNKFQQMVYQLKVTRRQNLEWFEKQELVSFTDYNKFPNLIVECVYHFASKKWVVLRDRPDKKFPNSIITANSVWEDIVNPLPFSTLMNYAPDTPEKLSYVKRIMELDSQFLSQHFIEKRRFLSYSYDLFPDKSVEEVPLVFGICAPGFKEEIRKIMLTALRLHYTDKFILEQICRLTKTYRIYGNDEEAAFLESTIKQYVSVPTIFDVRRYKDTGLCNLAHEVASVRSTAIQRILADKTKYVLGTFNNSIVAQDNSYRTYKTVRVEELNEKPVEVSEVNSTLPWMKKGMVSAFRKWIDEKDTRIADLTAHIGVDSMVLANLFPGSMIYAYDNDPVVFKALTTNIKASSMSKIKPYYEDSAYCVYEKWSADQFDVVYIDAPRNKSAENANELFLHSEFDYVPDSEVRNIKFVSQYILQHQIAKSVILKVPASYNVKGLKEWFDMEVIELQNGQTVEYLMIHLKPLTTIRQMKSASPITVWSIPYVDDYNRLFNFTSSQQQLFVRYPTNLVLAQFTSLFYQYLFMPYTSRPLQLVDYQQIDNYASKYGYKNFRTTEHPTFSYIHLIKNDAILPDLPKEEIVKPSTLCEKPVEPVESDKRLKPSKTLSVAASAFVPCGPSVKPSHPTFSQQQEENMKNMRKYHNEVKKGLIDNYCRNKRVLDLGAGYGGDLHKYSNVDVTELVLVEPSEVNIKSESNPEGLLKRLEFMLIKERSDIINTVGQDTETILAALKSPNRHNRIVNRVDVVASFFSMTFLFESRSILRGFLQTVHSSLIEGGYFIGTMMSGEKTFEALRAVEKGSVKVYGPADIVKQYSNEDKKDTGMKIWINIKDSIVINQNEYLSFFSILQEEAARLELSLVRVFDFNPNLYHAEIPEVEKEFSRLNIGFIFRKMPKKLSGSLTMLKPDQHRECINLYGENQNMIRSGVNGDGSCLYHSYLYNISPEYRSNKDSRNETVVRLRADLSRWSTDERMLQILSAEMFQEFNNRMNSDNPYFNKADPSYNLWFKLFPADFKIENYSTWYETILTAKERNEPVDNLLFTMNMLVKEWCSMLRRDIINVESWADNRHIMLLMAYTDVNIYIISSVSRCPTVLLFNSYKVSRKQSMIILSMNDFHYEPMAFMMKGVAKRIMKPFDTNLIYLHHALMKLNQNK